MVLTRSQSQKKQPIRTRSQTRLASLEFCSLEPVRKRQRRQIRETPKPIEPVGLQLDSESEYETESVSSSEDSILMPPHKKHISYRHPDDVSSVEDVSNLEDTSNLEDVSNLDDTSNLEDLSNLEDTSNLDDTSNLEDVSNLEDTSNIDFDDAHDCWMANKKKMGNGTYVYICGKPMRNGKCCQRIQCCTIGLYSGCTTHYKWEERLENETN